MLEDILDTPAVLTDPLPKDGDPPASLGVHLLCCYGDHVQAMWTLKSFYAFSGARCPLTIHVQGWCAPEVLDRLKQHFPAARVIAQAESDALVEPALQARGLERLRQARQVDLLMMRVADFHLLTASSSILSFDADVLFFRRPTELLAAAADIPVPHLAQRDCYVSYTMTPDQALTDLGVPLVPQLNCGIVLEARNVADMDRVDRYLAHPRLAVHHWHREQTLRALCAQARGPVRHLPDTYLLAPDAHPRPEDLVARHYATTFRSLYASEGLATVRRLGLFELLRTPAPSLQGAVHA